MQNNILHTFFCIQPPMGDLLWPSPVATCQLACSPLVPWEPILTLLQVNRTEKPHHHSNYNTHQSVSRRLSPNPLITGLFQPPSLEALRRDSSHRNLPPHSLKLEETQKSLGLWSRTGLKGCLSTFHLETYWFAYHTFSRVIAVSPRSAMPPSGLSSG